MTDMQRSSPALARALCTASDIAAFVHSVDERGYP
jgi:hypothetical protein